MSRCSSRGAPPGTISSAQGTWVELHEQVHGRSDAELEIANRDGSRRFLVSATLAQGRIEGVLQDVTEQPQGNRAVAFHGQQRSLDARLQPPRHRKDVRGRRHLAGGGQADGDRLHRPRPLQADQRPVRPWRRRRSAQAGLRTHGDDAVGRPADRPRRRRRIRDRDAGYGDPAGLADLPRHRRPHRQHALPGRRQGLPRARLGRPDRGVERDADEGCDFHRRPRLPRSEGRQRRPGDLRAQCGRLP